MSYRRRRSPLPLTEFLEPITAKTLQKRGFVTWQLLRDWAQIIGPQFAPYTLPQTLRFPPHSTREGTLTIQVASGLATELQYHQPILLERIAQFFGYRAVAHIRMVQVPGLHITAPTKDAAAPAAPLPEEAQAHIQRTLHTIEDTDLHTRLQQLGEAIWRAHSKTDSLP